MEQTIGQVKFNFDTWKVSEGLYTMHLEHGHAAPLAYGMLNAAILESAERELKEVVNARLRQSHDILKVEELQEKVKHYVNACVHEITVNILNMAKTDNILIV